jgi:8-oxo-dGTP pyrophosphatase MutT (NUDIX family)
MKKRVLKEWKTLSSKEIHRNHLFALSLENAVCPRNGKDGNFYVFKFGDWVNVLAVTPEDKLVMIKQFRHGNKRIEWEIPGGLIDASDKNPESAGARELLEETGFTGRIIGIICSVHPNPALQNNLCHTLLVLDAVKTSESSLETCEDIETHLMPVSKVKKMIFSGEIKHSLVLNALQFYFYQRKLKPAAHKKRRKY